MLPLLPFALGLLTGATAIRLLKSDSARSGLDKAKSGLGKAQDHLRDAAVSGLAAIEHSSARARDRLSGRPEAAAAAATPAVEPAAEAAAKPAPKPRRKAAAPRKRTPKAAAGKEQTS